MIPVSLAAKLRIMAGIRRTVELLEHPISAWTILAASLLLTFGAWSISERTYEKRMEERFAFNVSSVVDAIEERLLEYEQVLRGGVGLHAASNEVSRYEWRQYVANCELSKYFPGIQGMGVAIPLAADEKSRHESMVRKEGFADYQILPSHEREFYTSIIYLEPFDWRNQRAFGYDMYSNPTRREAMDRAIRTGEPAMSGKVTLLQEAETDVQNGWLYYLPVFKKATTSELPQEPRQTFNKEDIECFVYAAFRADDLMAGILGQRNNEVKFEIYDSKQPEIDRLLFDSDGECHLDAGNHPAYVAKKNLRIRGRDWTLFFESSPRLLESAGTNQSSLVAFAGLLVDSLLFFIIATIGRQKRQAVDIAREITKDVRAREELISQILGNASEAIVTVDERGCIELANKVARSMFGFPDSSRKIDFNDYLGRLSWSALIDKLDATNECQYKCTVEAMRDNGETFVCRLNLASFIAGKTKYHILVAQDETDRIASDRMMSEINDELIRASKTAAKVEFANGVLHNVGNIVNSISVSTVLIRKQVERLSVSKLDRVCRLITEQEAGFADFVQNDTRGQKLPTYLKKLNDTLVEEKSMIEEEFRDLSKNVSHMKEVITAQQSDAKSNTTSQLLDPQELLSDAVTANKATLANHDVEICQEIEEQDVELYSDKHKILQILVNLIKNANDALVENQTANPRIVTRVKREDNKVVFEVADNGVGIANEDVDKIFKHGFSTKQSGHGFGLHSSTKAAIDLGGNLSVSSDGIGTGATFTLAIPIADSQISPSNEQETSVPFESRPQEVMV